ncbi:MAG: hypothetical protein V1787_00710 [Candidatus Micrarchaeota archaeon]
MNKGFVFTADALFALTAISVLATSYVIIHSIQYQSQKYASLENQGRDYLRLVYREGFANFTNESFHALTGHNCYGCIQSPFWGFETEADLEDWTIIYGSWQLKDIGAGVSHIVLIEAGTPGFSNSTITTGKYYWSNYSVSAKVAMGTTGSTDIMGIGIYSNSTGGRYVCALDFRTGTYYIAVYKAFNSTSPYVLPADTAVARTPLPVGYDSHVFHDLNVSAFGGVVNCSTYDNTNTISAVYYDPNPLDSGKVTLGRGEYQSAAQYDNITINFVAGYPPRDVPFVMRSSMLTYPWECGCSPYEPNCSISNASPCLRYQEPLEADWVKHEVWVN